MKARHPKPRTGGTYLLARHLPRWGHPHYGHGVSLVERASRSGVIWSGTTTASVRPSPYVAHHALLSIARSHDPLLQLPDEALLLTWLDTLSQWGYHSVSTSALAPIAATALHDIGFSTAQDLVLLEHHHRDTDNFIGVLPSLRGRWPGSRFPSQPVITEILHLDCAAFGNERQMDLITLREALCATEQSRVFVSYVDKLLVGFVIVGVSDTHGFIQRLAVDPNCRNSGVGTRLVQTALAWIQAKDCVSTVVNTEASNVVALHVYENFGFAPMNYRLAVLEKNLMP